MGLVSGINRFLGREQPISTAAEPTPKEQPKAIPAKTYAPLPSSSTRSTVKQYTAGIINWSLDATKSIGGWGYSATSSLYNITPTWLKISGGMVGSMQLIDKVVGGKNFKEAGKWAGDKLANKVIKPTLNSTLYLVKDTAYFLSDLIKDGTYAATDLTKEYSPAASEILKNGKEYILKNAEIISEGSSEYFEFGAKKAQEAIAKNGIDYLSTFLEKTSAIAPYMLTAVVVYQTYQIVSDMMKKTPTFKGMYSSESLHKFLSITIPALACYNAVSSGGNIWFPIVTSLWSVRSILFTKTPIQLLNKEDAILLRALKKAGDGDSNRAKKLEEKAQFIYENQDKINALEKERKAIEKEYNAMADHENPNARSLEKAHRDVLVLLLYLKGELSSKEKDKYQSKSNDDSRKRRDYPGDYRRRRSFDSDYSDSDTDSDYSDSDSSISSDGYVRRRRYSR
jgi:hypothetical protein